MGMTNVITDRSSSGHVVMWVRMSLDLHAFRSTHAVIVVLVCEQDMPIHAARVDHSVAQTLRSVLRRGRDVAFLG